MITEYKNGKMIITHESGAVSEYTKTELEKLKADADGLAAERIKVAAQIQDQIGQINNVGV